MNLHATEWALVLSIIALANALASMCITLWRTRRSYNDSDIEELADEVGRLARRARADTMRRVRAEKGASTDDGATAGAPPPELRPVATAPEPRSVKAEWRRQLLGDTRH